MDWCQPGRRRPSSVRLESLQIVNGSKRRLPATLAPGSPAGQIPRQRPDGADRQTLNIKNLAGSADPQVPRGDVVDRVLVTVNHFADASSLSRRLVQKYVAAGTIKSVKIGRARRIPASELDRIVREGVTEL